MRCVDDHGMQRTHAISLATALVVLAAATYVGFVAHTAERVDDSVVVAAPASAATVRENDRLRIVPHGTRPTRNHCAGCAPRASRTPRLTMGAARADRG